MKEFDCLAGSSGAIKWLARHHLRGGRAQLASQLLAGFGECVGECGLKPRVAADNGYTGIHDFKAHRPAQNGLALMTVGNRFNALLGLF